MARTEPGETGAASLGRLVAASVPDDRLDLAVGRVADCLALCIAAQHRTEVALVRNQVVENSGTQRAAAVGAGRLPPESAALLNGTASHALGLDDFHAATGMHPMVTVVPAALSTAEAAGATGRQFLTAVLVGYEVACRLGRAAMPGTAHGRGFHPTSVFGTVAAGAAAAAALGLRDSPAAHAIALSATRAAGLYHFAPDAMTKPLQAGWAAAAGVGAAFLARRGITGPLDILESRHGLLWAVAGEGAYNIGPLLAPAHSWAIQEVAYKPYAHSTDFHTAVDAALEVMRETHTTPDAIERIDVYLPPSRMPSGVDPLERQLRPSGTREAQQSLPFAMAVALLHAPASGVVDTFHTWFATDRLSDPQVLRVAAMVHAHTDPELESPDALASPAAVTITTRSGQRLTHRRTAHAGSPACPFSLGDLSRRAASLIGPHIDLVGLAARLKQATGVAELADAMLQGSPPEGHRPARRRSQPHRTMRDDRRNSEGGDP